MYSIGQFSGVDWSYWHDSQSCTPAKNVFRITNVNYQNVASASLYLLARYLLEYFDTFMAKTEYFLAMLNTHVLQNSQMPIVPMAFLIYSYQLYNTQLFSTFISEYMYFYYKLYTYMLCSLYFSAYILQAICPELPAKIELNQIAVHEPEIFLGLSMIKIERTDMMR